MFGIRIRRDESEKDRGVLRLHVNEKGVIKSIEMASMITPEEIAPALSRLFVEVNTLDKEARADRLEVVLERARKKAGIIERVSGKAQNRQSEALEHLPSEEYRGPPGDLVAIVQGDFSLLRFESNGLTATDAIARCEKAIEAARKVAEEAWISAVEKQAEEEPEPAAPPEADQAGG